MTEKTKFFKEIINKLKKNKIECIFLRNYSFIENGEKEGEIDILIKSEDLRKLKKIFNKIDHCHHYKNNIDLTPPFLIRIVRNSFSVDLDFQTKGVGYCGMPILKEDYFFKNVEKKSFYNILNAEGRFLMLFVHGFIFKKKLNYFKKYEKEFFELFYKLNKKDIEKRMSTVFNGKYAKTIIGLIEKKDLIRLYSLRRKLILSYLTKYPLNILKIATSKIMRFRNYFKVDRFFYLINPFEWAPFISFIGVDGSGKSTLSAHAKDYLDKFGIRSVLLPGGVFLKLTPIKRIKKKNLCYSEKVSLKNKESRIKLTVRFILQFPLQLKIAYYRKQGYLIITDRYTYDLIFFYSANGFLKKIIKVFTQKPTRCFYVKTNPTNISQRSVELNLEAINSITNRIEDNQKTSNLLP